jgi:hypothetical protein
MLDTYRPNYKRRCYWLVLDVNFSLAGHQRISAIGGNFAVKNVPVDIRHILVAESAANDGLAYPFLSISIYLITEASGGTAFEKWFLISWLCTYCKRSAPTVLLTISWVS